MLPPIPLIFCESVPHNLCRNRSAAPMSEQPIEPVAVWFLRNLRRNCAVVETRMRLASATVTTDVLARFATSSHRTDQLCARTTAPRLTGKSVLSGRFFGITGNFINVCVAPVGEAASRKSVSSGSPTKCRASHPRISDAWAEVEKLIKEAR
jgi:hypothetical protein